MPRPFESQGGEASSQLERRLHPADSNSLLLTHYCMIGNQPHMKAKPKAGENKVAFEFVKATNLKSDKDMYMHAIRGHNSLLS